MKNKKLLGLSILALVAIFVASTFLFGNFKNDGKSDDSHSQSSFSGNSSESTIVYVAAGGGKEDYLADKDILKILNDDYHISPVYDTWSNGKTITKPLIREYVNLGDKDIAKRLADGENIGINTEGVSRYDALFTSDQRFYDYYRMPVKENEPDRYTTLAGGMMLNTPIVMYSWKSVVTPLMNEGIVSEKDGVYYVSDMEKMMNMILEGKKWQDIGLDLYGYLNIRSTDPVTSSPGATYYGLLLSILSGGEINDATIDTNLETLKEFYDKSGYMNNTPADLFERYLKTGVGGEPIIVDYEKSLIEFINSNPNGFNQVKDEIVLLYPEPTIWNSHCFMAFSENGKKLYDALQDERIQQIAWEKYGFRTGTANAEYDVSNLGIKVPKNINQTVPSLKMEYYNKLIDFLK